MLHVHNQTHKIVHSAMYYQNLIIIHECSKKQNSKNSKSFFLTPTCTCRNMYASGCVNDIHFILIIVIMFIEI